MPHIAFVGLGSNLEGPEEQLNRAFMDIDKLPGTRVIARSSLYRSAPLGLLDQPDFVNAVAKITTDLAPQDLLQALLLVEHSHGRRRSVRNAPRTLDLDILLYDDMQLHEHGLTIPHPQMQLRAFVLQPLLEIAPQAAIPGIGAAAEAIKQCADQRLEKIAQTAGNRRPDAV